MCNRDCAQVGAELHSHIFLFGTIVLFLSLEVYPYRNTYFLLFCFVLGCFLFGDFVPCIKVKDHLETNKRCKETQHLAVSYMELFSISGETA